MCWLLKVRNCIRRYFVLFQLYLFFVCVLSILVMKYIKHLCLSNGSFQFVWHFVALNSRYRLISFSTGSKCHAFVRCEKSMFIIFKILIRNILAAVSRHSGKLNIKLGLRATEFSLDKPHAVTLKWFRC